jgi:uncharacterized membrane protein
MQRHHGVDLLRGIVIVLMALDHTRDFFSPTAFPPEDLQQASMALFLTRWVTHFCAPAFVFLAGTSAWLQTSQGVDGRTLGRFLAVRGLWLIAIEVLVINFSWRMSLGSGMFLQVIWVLGASMLVLALLVQAPRWVALAFGAATIVLHNLLDGVTAASLGGSGWIWNLLHEAGAVQVGEGYVLYVAYPLIPWSGVMALGYGIAPWLVGDRRDDARLRWAGLAMIVAFVALRLSNVYGNPQPWTPDPRGLAWSVMAALNTAKYPPSLAFLLMTLGPALIALTLLDRARGAWSRPIAVFGRVPLFFYLLHVPLIHALATAWSTFAYGQRVGPFADNAAISGYAPSLPRVYLAWVVVLLVLYPACAWYDRYKRAHPQNRWLRLI